MSFGYKAVKLALSANKRSGSGLYLVSVEDAQATTQDITERLYREADFNLHTDYCERYGTDLITGRTNSEMEHRAMNSGERPMSSSSLCSSSNNRWSRLRVRATP